MTSCIVYKRISHIWLISFFIYPFFFLSNKFFHHISSTSMSASVFKFCIHDEDNQVYNYKQNQGAEIFTFAFFLAHLSRRLTGELIGYPWIRRPSVRRRPSSTFSNIFSSETAWPIKAKFYVEPSWEGERKFI